LLLEREEDKSPWRVVPLFACLPPYAHNTGGKQPANSDPFVIYDNSRTPAPPTLLSQVRLSLLHAGHHHVASRSGGQPVQPGSPPANGDDVQVLGTRVVRAVHDCGHWETQGHAELVTAGSTLDLVRHFEI